MIWQTGAGAVPLSPDLAITQSGQLMCYKNRTTSKATDTELLA
jgi:hypothetical protein